jgi:biotin carboxyl carrier protein
MIYQHGGLSYTISLQPLGADQYRVTMGEREIEVTAVPFDGGWLLTLGNQQMRVYAAARGSERWIGVEGETVTLTVPETRTRASRAGAGDLTAQMPGQVREVFVQAGEKVKSGQTLLVLEAMKMEIRVSASADGQVKRLLVRAGDVVDRGQRLVEMEEAN